MGGMLKIVSYVLDVQHVPSFSVIQYLSDVKKININQATYVQLVSLPGIGPKDAHQILSFRAKNGKIQHVEMLKEKILLSEKSIQKALPFLKVEP